MSALVTETQVPHPCRLWEAAPYISTPLREAGMERDTHEQGSMIGAKVHHFLGEAFQIPGLPTSLFLRGGGQGGTDLYAGPQERHNIH